MSTLARRRQGRRASGQSMAEVVIIVFLVGIGAIGLVGLFGDNIRGLFGGSAAALAGDADVANTGKEAQRTKWNLKGGSLSAYGSQPGPGFNPGGAGDSPSYSLAPGGGSGFNPGGSSDSGNAPPP